MKLALNKNDILPALIGSLALVIGWAITEGSLIAGLILGLAAWMGALTVRSTKPTQDTKDQRHNKQVGRGLVHISALVTLIACAIVAFAPGIPLPVPAFGFAFAVILWFVGLGVLARSEPRA